MLGHDADSSALEELLKHRNVRSQLTQQRTQLERLANQAEALKHKLVASKPLSSWHQRDLSDDLPQHTSNILADFGSSDNLYGNHHMQQVGDLIPPTSSEQQQPANSKQQANLTQNERKLVKLLKKVQKDKDKLSVQVEQLLDSQHKLLQQLHHVQTQLEHQQGVQPQPQQATSLQQASYHQPIQCSSPVQQQMLQQYSSSPSKGSTAGHNGLLSAKHVRSSIDSELDLQLQQLQEQIDTLSREQQPAQQSPGIQALGAASATAANGAYCSSNVYGSAGWITAAGGGQQLEMIADQAATILELKTVISELESQTSTLRTQASKQDSTAAALAECQAQLQEKDKQLLELQQQHEQQQEVSQAALQEALASARAAEDECRSLKQQLQQQQAYQDESTRQHQEAVSSLRQQLQEQTDTLSSEVSSLRSERQQLLQQLQKANEHIADLHDELGPALLRGSPSPTRRSAAAAAVSCGPNVSRVLWQDAQQQQQQQQQAGASGGAAAADEQALQGVQQGYTGSQQQQQQQDGLQVLLQQQAEQAAMPAAAGTSTMQHQQYDTLQKQQMLSLAADNARLAVALAESMAQLDLIRTQQQQQQQGIGVNRSSSPARSSSPFAAVPDNQLAAAADNPADGELQQQRLQLQLAMVQDQASSAAALSEQQQRLLQQQQDEVLQLKQDLASVQQEYVMLQREQEQRTHDAVVAAVQVAAAAPGAPIVTQIFKDSHHLRLQLLSQTEQLHAAEAQFAIQQAELVDRSVIEQTDARNRALLQEVSRLLTENTNLKQQQQLLQMPSTVAAAAAAAAPARRSSLIAVPDLLTVLPPVQHQEQQQQQVEPSTGSPAAAAAAAAGSGGGPGSSSRVTSRQHSLSRLASSSGNAVARPSGLSAAAAAVAAAELDAGVSSTRKPASTGGSMRVRWSEYQLAVPTESTAAAAQSPLSPQRHSSPNILLSPQQQQQQQHRQQQHERLGTVSDSTTGSISFANGSVQSRSAAAAPAVPGGDHDAGRQADPAAAAASERGAIISAVLQRSRSRLSVPGGDSRSSLVSNSTTALEQQQQQQQQWSGQFLDLTTDDSGHHSSAAVQQDHSKNSVSGSGSGTANSERSSLVQAVLSRSRSRLSGVDVSGAGATVAAGEASSDHATSLHGGGAVDRDLGVLLSPSSNHQQQWEQQQQHQRPYASRSVTNSLAGGNSDRASLVAAVLQRQKSKTFASDAGLPYNSSSSSSSGSSVAGERGRAAGNGGSLSHLSNAERTASFVQESDAGNNISYSRSGSINGNKDRASIVAAVLAQRQQRNSAAGGAAAAAGGSFAGSFRSEGAVSLNGSLTGGLTGGLTASNSSSSVGGRVSSAADRASLVAAVLAKHSTVK